MSNSQVCENGSLLNGVRLVCAGFEDGMVKPFWIRKDSVDVFKGSYSGKDWKHVGDGAWEPKPRKMQAKRVGGRGNRKGKRRVGAAKSSESREQSQTKKFSTTYSDQAYTADSEVQNLHTRDKRKRVCFQRCVKSGSGALGGNGERVVYRKSNGDPNKRGCLEKMRSGTLLPTDSTRPGEKSMDCNSQSDIRAMEIHSEGSFPSHDDTRQQQSPSAVEGKHDEETEQNGTKTASGESPAASGSSQDGNKDKKDKSSNRKDSSMGTTELSE